MKIQNRKNTLYVSFILIILMCIGCEGNKDLYLINCSDDVAIIRLTPDKHFRESSIPNYKKEYPDPQFKPTDSIISLYQIEYYQEEFNNRESNFQVNGDLLTVDLKPGESLRLVLTMWIFFRGKTNAASLNIDNLTIITKSDTCIAQSRAEILKFQKDKRFRYDKYYEDKVGPKSKQHRKILIK